MTAAFRFGLIISRSSRTICLMRYNYSRIFLLGALLLAIFTIAPLSNADSQGDIESSSSNSIYIIRIEGAISPGTSGYLTSSIAKAQEEGAKAFIVELDTPGGLAQSMRSMVKVIMNAPMPVIVYVSPSGAQAASAGVMVTMAADVAVMAPGTNIGAAHPVAAGGKDIPEEMEKKVLNDMVAFAQGIAQERGRNAGWVKKAVERSVSITASEAVELKVVDMTAESRADLLNKIDGMEIKRGSLTFKINSKNAKIVEIEETFRDRILRTLADPNIAYILMMLGLAGLYFELSHPGTILPGVVGGICLILAFYSFQTLPVNYAGILLIFLGIILFILEMKVTSFGMLTVGGLISLTLGSLMLFKTPEEYMRVSMKVMIPVLVTVAGFFITITWLVVKAHVVTTATGFDGLLGLTGPVKEWSEGRGKVIVHGEWWHAYAEDEIKTGDQVEVIEVNGMHLFVRKVKEGSESA